VVRLVYVACYQTLHARTTCSPHLSQARHNANNQPVTCIRRADTAALLQVLVYNGVKDTVEKGSVARRSSKSSSSSSSSASTAQQPFALLSAPFLAQHDVVLTTYDVLRSEVHHAAVASSGSTTAGSSGQQQSSGRTTRYAKTYKVVPSPLTALRWWRVAIDEAQMVETTTTRK
jgi:SNF2 family DNA or RNA helicase